MMETTIGMDFIKGDNYPTEDYIDEESSVIRVIPDKSLPNPHDLYGNGKHLESFEENLQNDMKNEEYINNSLIMLQSFNDNITKALRYIKKGQLHVHLEEKDKMAKANDKFKEILNDKNRNYITNYYFKINSLKSEHIRNLENIYKVLIKSLLILNSDNFKTNMFGFKIIQMFEDLSMSNIIELAIMDSDFFLNAKKYNYKMYESITNFINKHSNNIIPYMRIIEHGIGVLKNIDKKKNHVFKIIPEFDYITNLYTSRKQFPSIYDSLVKQKITFNNINILSKKANSLGNIPAQLYVMSIFLERLSFAMLEVISGLFEDLNGIFGAEFRAIFDEQLPIIQIPNNSIINNIESLNPWISTDYHLLKELKYGNGDTSRSLDILKMHNKFVKPNDVFFFLGDISESEFFDQNRNDIIEKLIKLFNRFNGKKVLLIGNNDTGSDEIYKKMGFLEIYHAHLETSHLIFSHDAVEPFPKGKLNIHGHLHGSGNYYHGLSTKNRVDAYYGIFGQPIKLKDLVQFYKSGKYNNIIENFKKLAIN